MARLALTFHWLLAAYLWLISWVSLGSWNAQPGPHMLSAVRSGQVFTIADAGFFVFVTLPAIFFTIAVLRRSFVWLMVALVVDLVWLFMQGQSWWIPYIFGASHPWQIKYAKGPTTKLLPSFGRHIAPDGMHLMISVLIMAAMFTGVCCIPLLRRSRAAV